MLGRMSGLDDMKPSDIVKKLRGRGFNRKEAEAGLVKFERQEDTKSVSNRLDDLSGDDRADLIDSLKNQHDMDDKGGHPETLEEMNEFFTSGHVKEDKEEAIKDLEISISDFMHGLKD